MWSARGAEDTRTAKRRRERRLRQFLRHERLTVAMLLAETQHHGAPWGQNKARSGGEVRVARHGHDPEEPLPQPELFDVFDEELGGGRPPPLPEVAGPQARVLRRTVEPIIESFLPVQMIDVPVPQSAMGGCKTKSCSVLLKW